MAKYKPETEPIFRYGSGLLLAVPSGCENCITQFYSKEYPNGLAVSPENYVVKNKTCYVRIPMELLENISPILVFAYELTEDKAITKTKTVLNVFDRPMPQDYVFVASDIVTYETAEALIRGLRQIKAELEELEASLEVKESDLDILMEDAREILADIDTENFIKADDYNADKSATETAINNKADRVHHHNGEDVIFEIEGENPISLNELLGYIDDGKADRDHTHTTDEITHDGRTLSVHLDEFAESVYGDLDTLFEEKANRDELLNYVTKESVVPYTTTGTKIASIGEKNIYAPAGGSGGSKYIFEMEGNALVIYEEEDGTAREIFRANVGGLTRTQVQQMLSDYAKDEDVQVLYGAVSSKADMVHRHELSELYALDGDVEKPLGEALEDVFNGIAEQIPTELPNPNALTINGTSYDGSQPVEMTINGGGGGETKLFEKVGDPVDISSASFPVSFGLPDGCTEMAILITGFKAASNKNVQFDICNTPTGYGRSMIMANSTVNTIARNVLMRAWKFSEDEVYNYYSADCGFGANNSSEKYSKTLEPKKYNKGFTDQKPYLIIIDNSSSVEVTAGTAQLYAR